MAMKFNAATIFILVLFNNTENIVASCIYTIFHNVKWALDHSITYLCLLINFILIELPKNYIKKRARFTTLQLVNFIKQIKSNDLLFCLNNAFFKGEKYYISRTLLEFWVKFLKHRFHPKQFLMSAIKLGVSCIPSFSKPK